LLPAVDLPPSVVSLPRECVNQVALYYAVGGVWYAVHPPSQTGCPTGPRKLLPVELSCPPAVKVKPPKGRSAPAPQPAPAIPCRPR
jgi:hypothetical protein